MDFRFDDFQACLKQTFLLQLDDYSDELELIRVERHEDSHALGEREAFSIVFQSNRAEILAQQSCRLAHPRLGELDLFIVPIGQDDAGVRYEAVFS